MLKNLLRRSSIYFITLMIGKLLTAIFFLFLARRLQPERFGLITYFVTLVQILSVIADVGLKNWYQKQVASGCSPALFGGIAKWRLVFCVFTIVALTGLQWSYHLLPPGLLAATIVALLLEAGISVADAFYLAQLKSIHLGVKLIIRNILLLPVLLFIHSPTDYSLFFFAYNLSLLLTLVFYFPWATALSPSCRRAKLPNIKGSLPYAAIDGLGIIYGRADHLLIEKISGQSALGVFGVAYRYVDAVNLLPQALFHNLFPLAAKKNGISKTQVVKMVVLMTGLGLVVASALALASPLLTTWILGDQYQEAATLLRYFFPVLILFFFNAPLNTIIQSSKLVTNYLPWLTITVIINITTNLLLISKFGIIGAVGAMIISESILTIVNLYLVRRLYHHVKN